MPDRRYDSCVATWPIGCASTGQCFVRKAVVSVADDDVIGFCVYGERTVLQGLFWCVTIDVMVGVPRAQWGSGSGWSLGGPIRFRYGLFASERFFRTQFVDFVEGEKMITKAKFVVQFFYGNGSPVTSARRCRFCFYTSFGERSMVCSRNSSDDNGRRNWIWK